MTINVEEKPTARLQLMATNAATGNASGSVAIDGAASAGSKVIVAASGATDVSAERVRVDFPAGTYKIRWVFSAGLSSHPFSVRLSISPPDMATAHLDLRDDVYTRRLYSGVPDYMDTASLAFGTFSVYLVGIPLPGSTLASCKGQVDWEIN